ncbi:phage portal protein [Georgenia sp. MJ173]|uniref:phage portal protein n=1 Tax=Georgenia sunbinii TaxID=3117728 RepID=UPI002F269F2B
MSEILTALLQRLDEKIPAYDVLDKTYAGKPPLSFLAPDAREVLGKRFGHLGSNLCRLAVTSLGERLRVIGFTRDGVSDPLAWGDWIKNDLDQTAPVGHREALALGSSFVIVWADEHGEPSISVESARQVAAVRDPGTRQIVAAVKRWTTATTTEAVLYEADKITRYRARGVGSTTGFTVVETIDNPLGVVPVVELSNTDRLLAEGVSEMADTMPLQDALNKLLADMMVGSENYARPRRYATGIELEEDADGNVVNPFPEGDKMMIGEDPAAKFGQLPPADLASYEKAIRVVVEQIEAVSGLPAHYVGITSNQPPSADALRAAEASLTARAEQKQQTFGRAWERVAALAHAVRTGTDPTTVDMRVQWADPATRSVAQEADAVVKLFQSGLLPATYALAKLGYSDDEIRDIRADRRAEALDTAGTDLAGLIA